IRRILLPRKGEGFRMRLLSVAVALTASAFAADQPRLLFERDIVPIFTAHCWKCHGMENRKAGLDLRTPLLTLRGSDKGPVIVRGSAENSLLFQKISNGAMPPGKLLKSTKDQVELVRRWLIRREYLDLIALPPSPEEVEAFEADRSPDAWERLVDRLLANPHFGECWGRHWLDAAGYADVHGIDTNVITIRAGEGKWRY